ncbi:hypothetical protein [Methylomonas sp. AM2-LC]|uniref:hypothetical protein n=1 Tax=Methylomonas sp. AM2-LC TaxID=3153301 RepID=UPI0032651C35
MINSKRIAITGLLLVGLAITNSSQASLIAETVQGISVVYDDVTNVTWTADANLLGAMEANAIAQYGNDNGLIQAIINANNGVVYDVLGMYDTGEVFINNNAVGVYNLHSYDFFPGGAVSWYGAEAFIGYLNSINYANSSAWALPLWNDGTHSQGQFGELFYNELNGISGFNIPSNSFFNNINPPQHGAYWASEDVYGTAYRFGLGTGNQQPDIKITPYFGVWAVSSGNIAAVPIQSTFYLFGSVFLYWVFVRNRNAMLINFIPKHKSQI